MLSDMKAVILCGGKGTRMREETEFRPKPLVEIDEHPILWHIMKIYSYYNVKNFILCVGYKSDMIKRYFMEMCWRNNDFTIQTGKETKTVYHTVNEDNWNVTIVDTGLESQTGKRIKLVEKYIDNDDFFLTYGDGLSDVNIKELYENHISSGKIATLTGVNPISPFGIIEMKNNIVTSFKEKPILDDVINGGYMVLNKKIFDYIPSNNCAFEQEPLHNLAKNSELAIYKHSGFWTAIDTYKDVERVKGLWNEGKAPWKIWD